MRRVMSQRSMRKYDKEFKLNAINLFLEKGLSYKQISDELGIPQSTLIGWMKAYNKNKNNAFPGKGHTNNENAEVVQLRKELELLSNLVYAIRRLHCLIVRQPVLHL